MEPDVVSEPAPAPALAPVTGDERIDRMLAERFSRDRGYKVFVYRCTNPKCKAEDRMVYFADDNVAAWVNCWKCRSGYRLKPEVQAQERRGMFPFRHETFDGVLVALVDSQGSWLTMATKEEQQ